MALAGRKWNMMSKSLVEPGVWWAPAALSGLPGTAASNGIMGSQRGCCHHRSCNLSGLLGFAKSAGLVLRINSCKLAGWVDVWGGRTVYLIWCTQLALAAVCFISMGSTQQSFEGLACQVLQSFSCAGVQRANLSCIRMSVSTYLRDVMSLFNIDIWFYKLSVAFRWEDVLYSWAWKLSVPAVTVKTSSNNTGLLLPVPWSIALQLGELKIPNTF